MKTIIVNNSKVKCTLDGMHYSCHVEEHNLYFTTSIKDGDEQIIKKAKAMIKSKENFMRYFGILLNCN